MVAGSESALWLNMKVLTQPRRLVDSPFLAVDTE